uniref:Uncharacterized protein n=1 Tax=Setaria viridis TaxID=4556 RepID=A0A4U6TPS7_SETVI|nr:hypothetical protein SEVIR_7G122100v2 [Setaria viridis]
MASRQNLAVPIHRGSRRGAAQVVTSNRERLRAKRCDPGFTIYKLATKLHRRGRWRAPCTQTRRQGAAGGAVDEDLGHGHRMKDDVDTKASDFIRLKHRAWALQKSTTMYPAST